MPFPTVGDRDKGSGDVDAATDIQTDVFAVTVNGEIITSQEVGVTLGPEIARLMAEFPRRGPEPRQIGGWIDSGDRRRQPGRISVLPRVN